MVYKNCMVWPLLTSPQFSLCSSHIHSVNISPLCIPHPPQRAVTQAILSAETLCFSLYLVNVQHSSSRKLALTTLSYVPLLESTGHSQNYVYIWSMYPLLSYKLFRGRICFYFALWVSPISRTLPGKARQQFCHPQICHLGCCFRLVIKKQRTRKKLWPSPPPYLPK